MNIVGERQNLFQLWLRSWQLIVNNIGKLLMVILIAGAYNWIVYFIARQIGNPLLQQLAMGLAGLFNSLLLMFCAVLIQRIVGTSAQGQTVPFPTLLASSIIPFLYQFLLLFLVGLAYTALVLVLFFVPFAGPVLIKIVLLGLYLTLTFFVTDMFSGSTRFLIMALGLIFCVPLRGSSQLMLILIAVGALLFFGGVLFLTWTRLFYVFPSIALKEKGPFEAIVYSWDLSRDNFLNTLGARAIYLLCTLLGMLGVGACVFALIMIIPLYFANSFNLLDLSLGWKAVLWLMAAWFWLCLILAITFQTLVLLRNDPGSQAATGKEDSPIPLPDLELPAPAGTPEAKQAAQAAQNKPAAQDPQDPQTQEFSTQVVQSSNVEDTLKELGVSKESVKSINEGSADVTMHLHEVYKPRPEDIIEYIDEDRMPTILFDDEMAKQLEENAAKFAATHTHDKNNPGEDPSVSIKISK